MPRRSEEEPKKFLSVFEWGLQRLHSLVMPPKSKKDIDLELEKNKNRQAFRKDEAEGRLVNLGPVWVAYVDGTYFDQADTLDEILEKLAQINKPSFLRQVNVPKQVVDLGGPNDVR